MSLESLLEEASRRGIRLWVEGDRLRYAGPQDSLTDDILQRLRRCKTELLQRLREGGLVTVHPVSFGQRALWFEYQLNPRSSAYNYAFSTTIRTELKVDALGRAFQAIVDRHAVLRTTYSLANGEPVQRVHDHQQVSFTPIDASGWSDAELSERVNESAHRPFDLEAGPVFRVELYRRSASEHLLLLNAHHITMDFRSLVVLIEELGRLYASECGQPGTPLPAVRTQYTDYARWQAAMLAGEDGRLHWAFWKERLGDQLPPLNLLTDRPRPAVRTYHGASLAFGLGPELSADLKRLARAEGVTLYMLMMAAFEALLHRYSGQEEFPVGSPMLGRTRPEFERTLGYFISPVVLRADVSGDLSFRELLQRTRSEVLAALEHQDCPFALLVQRLQPARDSSRSPFFDVMFNLNAADLEGNNAMLAMETEPQAQGEGQFDLILQIFDSGRLLSGTLEYNTDLFDAGTIERMAGHFRVLLAGIVADPGCRVAALPLLTEPERRGLLCGGEAGGLQFSVSETLHEWFERQVERTPDAVAVTFEGRCLTYRELNGRANMMARRLRRIGVGPETLVGICVERSLDLVVGLLGILKAGGAYVPLDPAYPKDRLAHMLSDSRTPVVLTQESLLAHLPDSAARVLCLDRDWPEIAAESAGNLPALAKPANPAYVIYTSGSTGKPKGVVVCHENVVRLFTATDAWFGFNEHDVWTLFHSYAFDFSVWELWGALLYGGRLVVVPYLVSRSPEALCRLLRDEGVTVLNQTPSAFCQLIQAESRDPLPDDSPLRYVIFGGEALDLRRLRPWYERHGDRQPRLVNMYGITETTVHVTYRPLSLADVDAGRGSMIGRPIPDLQLHVLDAHGQPVPAGVPGELYVGGAGLARGYLNQPGLTAERFIVHSFDGQPGARLYRTGDLARRRPDGDVEYLGRVDQQVKIRGFRIEIGEIEAVLKACPGVADALVMAVGDVAGEKRLVGYIQAVADSRPTVENLRHHAGEKLPEYMVPASFVFLDAFPLTPSGKVDRKALPTMSASRPELESAFEPPSTPVEKALAAIWAEALGVDRIGVNDNFFSLGGDSILSVRVVAGAKAQGIEISLADAFQHQTIRELAAYAKGRAAEEVPVAKPVDPFELIGATDRRRLPAGIEDAYPLSRLQAGMLFHAQLNPDLAVYCNLTSLHVRLPLDAKKMQAAIDHVVARHPALRSWFDLTSYSEPLQLVSRDVCVPLVVEDIRHLDGPEQEKLLHAWIDAERTRNIDPGQSPLLRFHVHRRADDRIQLTWCEHHAILDGWSVATMLTEIVSFYLRLLGHAAAAEPVSSPMSFRDFVALERATIDSAETREFWTRKLQDASATRLARWHRNERVEPRRRFGQLPVAVPGELSDRLHELARRRGVPIKSLLLAAHLKVLSTWSGRREVLTGLIANGRPETAESERVLGLFLNTVPLPVDVGPGTWGELVGRAHAGELDVLRHRRYPLAEIQRSLGAQDLIETAFNFIHFHVYQGLSGLGPIEVLDTVAFERTNFALMATFSLDPFSERSNVGLMLHYDARELADEQVQAMGESYLKALRGLAFAPSKEHEAACLLPDAHRRLLVEAFNETSMRRPDPVCIHELFDVQAARTPEAIALMCGDQTLTYADLQSRSDRLAGYLRMQGVGPDVAVGVCMERTAELVVALLGVLKAGGAYVPLDAAYPSERLRFILEDADAPVVLATGKTAGRLEGYTGRVINLDRGFDVAPYELGRSAGANASPSNLAYIIYTSGSTGRPKGVAIEHRNTVEFIRWAREVYSDAELAGILASTSVCFDLSVFEVFVPLCHGGRVILVANALALPELDAAANVTLVNTVPSAMAELIRLNGLPRTVRTVNLAGEPLNPRLVDQIYGLGSVERVLDLYGPSEDTTYSTFALRAPGGPATIGKPISNTRVYILDEDLHPVPLGAVGELYISGAGLARGYWRRPDLTAERFVPDPFSREPGARMYRTGDLGRYFADGRIEFLGRSDHQVKLRGFRIELGEIEAAMNACPGVRTAVASVCGREADQRLVAYYVRQDDHEVEEARLRAHLAARLPAYMVPTGLVELAAMPLTPNGKIDRKRLPAWTGAGGGGAAVVAPRDEIEEKIATCWRELLGVDSISIDASFFEMGGHSLLATQAVSRLREIFQISLPLRSLFDAPTIEGMAGVIRQAKSGQAAAPMSAADDGEEREEIEL